MLTTSFGSALGRFFLHLLIAIPFSIPLLFISALPIAAHLVVGFLLMLLEGFFLFFGPLQLFVKLKLVNFESKPRHFLLLDDEKFGEAPIN
jgi:hypothetical protein